MERETLRSLSSLIMDAMRTKGVTTARLAEATGVPERYLELILEERFEGLPAAPYLHGYLVKIAEALSLNSEELWQEFLKNHCDVHRAGETDTLPTNRFAIPRLNRKYLLLGALVLAAAIFILLRLPPLRSTFDFSVNISDDLVVATSTFLAEGRVNPEDALTLDGETIYPDRDGRFTKVVSLKDGWNTLEFKVKRLLGEERTVVKQIYYATTTYAR